ncbi:hypothetical protein EVG20_g6508 [Dentipellis fragilis]|uniref:Protein kinase domain-containing protein n=1 Tax=Dentipellis fragilis TaxID=205917 RepID=A0A4Y9YPL7_9AGAM|nr:hypothetical protein EVG20_g6508 [Dentipellis fragilis]
MWTQPAPYISGMKPLSSLLPLNAATMLLQVSIHADEIHRSFGLYTANPDIVGFWTFRGKELVHKGRCSEIFRGRLWGMGFLEPADVVCKFVHGLPMMERLRRETQFYEGKLKPLQGAFVPRCYGAFMGQVEDRQMGCIILEYIGRPLQGMFHNLDAQTKLAIMDAAFATHSAGVRVWDWAERNILIDQNGQPRLIDFENAEDHQCGSKTRPVFGGLQPRRRELNCSQLYEICDMLRCWKPGTARPASMHIGSLTCATGAIKYLGEYRPIFAGMSPETLAASAPLHWPRDQVLVEAHRALDSHVKQYYPKGTPPWLTINREQRLFCKNRPSLPSHAARPPAEIVDPPSKEYHQSKSRKHGSRRHATKKIKFLHLRG